MTEHTKTPDFPMPCTKVKRTCEGFLDWWDVLDADGHVVEALNILPECMADWWLDRLNAHDRLAEDKKKLVEALRVAREQFDVITTYADAISKYTAANVVVSSGDKIISDVWIVRNRARNTLADIDRVLKEVEG